MTSTTPSPSPRNAVLAEVAERFPLWFSVWVAIGHIFTAQLLTPPMSEAVFTVVFPLAWVVAYYSWLPPERRPSRGTLVTLALTAPVVALIWWLPARLMYDGVELATLRYGFELAAPLWAVVLAAHCYKHRGWTGVLVFFVLGAIYGFNLENSGIELGYFTEPDYLIYIPWSHTPLTSVAGWCTMFYPSVYIADAFVERFKVRSRAVVPALIVSAAALSSDLHFDPIATALGMWKWNATLPPVWFGVPVVNFTSWFAALFAAAVAYYWVIRRTWTPRTRIVVAVLSIPVALAISAAVNLTIIGILEGFDGPSWTIFRRAVSIYILH